MRIILYILGGIATAVLGYFFSLTVYPILGMDSPEIGLVFVAILYTCCIIVVCTCIVVNKISHPA